MKRFLIFAMVSLTYGCALKLPEMDYQYRGDKFPGFVNAVTSHITCELAQAVQAQYNERDPQRRFLKKWGAKIALTLKAEEKSGFDPSVSYGNRLGIFDIAAGAHVGAGASREITLTYFMPFAELIDRNLPRNRDQSFAACVSLRDPIAGNLGINDTLGAGMNVWDSRGTTSYTLADGGTWDSITHHVTFELEASANATPSWTIKRVKLNPSGTLLSGSRTRTDELLITMGPTETQGKKVVPAQSTESDFYIERTRSVRN